MHLWSRQVLAADDVQRDMLDSRPFYLGPFANKRVEMRVLVSQKYRLQQVSATAIVAKFPKVNLPRSSVSLEVHRCQLDPAVP